MLARLSLGIARFLEVHIETFPSIPGNEEDSLVNFSFFRNRINSYLLLGSGL